MAPLPQSPLPMNPTQNPPLPEVAAALAPYIHTRAETLRIRRLLSAHLAASLTYENDGDSADGETPITHLTLAAPPSTLVVKRTPKELQGGGDARVRAAYLSALQSHAAAKKRYQALRDEIEELRESRAVDSASRDVTRGDGAAEEYIQLVKLRRKVERARVVDKAVEKVWDARLAEGGAGGIGKRRTGVREVVEEIVGKQPDMPSVKLEGIGEESGKAMVEEMVWRVKRGVVSAKADMDATEERKIKAKSGIEGDEVGVRLQVRGLRAAKAELVRWLEDELGKLQEESVLEDASPVKKRAAHAGDGDGEGRPPLEEIEERYREYVAVRAELVKTMDAVKGQEHSNITTIAPPKDVETSSPDTNAESVKVVDILPFMPSLLQTAREERALLQQGTYLRHQLALTSEESLRTIGRLADESHLVTPGASSALAWASAAKDVSVSTRQYLQGNLEEGEQKVISAEETLGEVQARRENFERLKGAF
ncbi:hypothetical protein BU16DRAFT_524440 [Lophium mytilinum]|uniref:Uncharacterized protein n=1 Tax=Lophium mytilinum TaxID=390894 RepID=A0A6A6R0L4_9PEZI|nr:hypothetical protein BU16DRAFT_524440 [Lophium mytilinum]